MSSTPETAPDRSSEAAAEKADATTVLSAAGLSARAVSALATVQVATVGELLALDSTRLNRLVAREAKDTRKEITTRYRAWARRLGKQPQHGQRRADGSRRRGFASHGGGFGRARQTRKDAAALHPRAQRRHGRVRQQHRTRRELLGKAPQRGIQLLKELQEDWAKQTDTRELLDAITDIARQVIADFGGVAAVTTLTAEIRARLPQAGLGVIEGHARERADRAAGGLLRVALDRLSEHEAAAGEKEFVRRRHGRRLALLANDEMLLAAAESAAKRADELVTADRNAVIPAPTRGPRAAGGVPGRLPLGQRRAGADPHCPPTCGWFGWPPPISKHAGVSGRGELHNIDMSPAAAVQVALTGLAQNESLSPSQIRSRVTARFPELDRVPTRPHLDTIIGQTNLQLVWDDERDVYRFPDSEPASATTMHTRKPTRVPAPAEAVLDVTSEDYTNNVALLQRSLGECGFVAVGVPIPPDRPGEHERVARALAETYRGQVVDVTTRLIAAMRNLAAQQGMSWDLIRGADAAEASSRDARGLRAVIDRVVPQLWAELQAAVFDGETSAEPLILTEVSPLARYGHLDILAKLSDLAAPRRRPVWVVLPQLRGQLGALVDRKPIQLGSPGGQFVLWREAPDAVPAGSGGTD